MNKTKTVISLAIAAYFISATPLNGNLEVNTQNLQVYSDGKGHYILMDRTELGDQTYYGDGKTFYEVANRIFSGGPARFHFEFDDSRYSGTKAAVPAKFADPRSTFEKSNAINMSDILFNNGKFTVRCGSNLVDFTEIGKAEAKKIVHEAKFIPLPAVRKHRFLAEVPSTGEIIYVSVDKYKNDDLKLFMGKSGQLKPVNYTKVTEYQDGGSLLIQSDKGAIRLWVDNNFESYLQTTGEGKETPVKRVDYWELKDEEIEAKIGKDLLAETQVQILNTPCDQFHPDKAHAKDGPETRKNHR